MSVPKGVVIVNSRSKNMKRVNAIRTSETNAMLDLLDDLENCRHGDYPDFNYWYIGEYQQFKNQLNSYRAQKIAKYLGKNISKNKLLRYSKPLDYQYRITNADIETWLNKYGEKLRKYWEFHKQVFIQNYL